MKLQDEETPRGRDQGRMRGRNRKKGEYAKYMLGKPEIESQKQQRQRETGKRKEKQDYRRKGR